MERPNLQIDLDVPPTQVSIAGANYIINGEIISIPRVSSDNSREILRLIQDIIRTLYPRCNFYTIISWLHNRFISDERVLKQRTSQSQNIKAVQSDIQLDRLFRSHRNREYIIELTAISDLGISNILEFSEANFIVSGVNNSLINYIEQSLDINISDFIDKTEFSLLIEPIFDDAEISVLKVMDISLIP